MPSFIEKLNKPFRIQNTSNLTHGFLFYRKFDAFSVRNGPIIPTVRSESFNVLGDI